MDFKILLKNSRSVKFLKSKRKTWKIHIITKFSDKMQSRVSIFRGAAKGGSTRSMDPPVLIVVGPGRSSSDFAGSDSYFFG